jgi:hypothetical protein
MSDHGWFEYAPEESTPQPESPPAPEQRAASAAQRSVPPSGVRRVTEDVSDNGLYEAFIEFLGCYGVARATATGVIRLDIAEDVYPTGREAGQPLIVRLSRAQLRRLAWAEEDIFDDTDLTVVPRTTRHVEVGFDTLTFRLAEAFESGVGARAGVQPGELVYDESINGLRYRVPF